MCHTNYTYSKQTLPSGHDAASGQSLRGIFLLGNKIMRQGQWEPLKLGRPKLHKELIHFLINLDSMDAQVKIKHNGGCSKTSGSRRLKPDSGDSELSGLGVIISSNRQRPPEPDHVIVHTGREEIGWILWLLDQVQAICDRYGCPFDPCSCYRLIAGSLLWIEEKRRQGIKWKSEDVARLIALDLANMIRCCA